MALSIRQIIKTRNVDAFADYLRDNVGVTVAKVHLSAILDQAAKVGGPDHDPWSESTWRMWLKGKATSPPQATHGIDANDNETSGTASELAAALNDTSAPVLSTQEYSFCEMTGANDLLCDYAEKVWQQLFPSAEAIGPWFNEEFERVGGRKLLGRAPLASWLFARLVFLGSDCVEEENDLGGYNLHLVAKSGARVVGVVLVEADSDRIEMHVEGKSSNAVDGIKKQFTKLLLDEFSKVARCELEVNAAELDATNSYGWTGSSFLGEANVSA